MKSTRKMVIHAPGGHAIERHPGHVARALISGARGIVEQQIQDRWMRKLRLRAKAAIVLVKLLHCRLNQLFNDARMQIRRATRKRFVVLNRRHHAVGGLKDFILALVIRMRHRQQNAPKPRTTVTLFFGKICAAEKWLALGCQNHGQWPTTLPAHRRNGRLVARVHVESLIAVHFNGDEVAVDDLGNLGVFIRFAIHHMAPVAPDRAYVEQDRLVQFARQRKGGLAPLLPCNRLMHRGAQIR